MTKEELKNMLKDNLTVYSLTEYNETNNGNHEFIIRTIVSFDDEVICTDETRDDLLELIVNKVIGR